MALKACTVVVHDLNDTAHSLDVTAETLFEAVAQALATMRGQDWVGEIGTREAPPPSPHPSSQFFDPVAPVHVRLMRLP